MKAFKEATSVVCCSIKPAQNAAEDRSGVGAPGTAASSCSLGAPRRSLRAEGSRAQCTHLASATREKAALHEHTAVRAVPFGQAALQLSDGFRASVPNETRFLFAKLSSLHCQPAAGRPA